MPVNQDQISKALTNYMGTDIPDEKKKDLLYLHFYNSAPRYITFPELFTHSFEDSTLSEDLISHLESNSANSYLDITEDNVVECNLHETAKDTKMLERVEYHLKGIMRIINVFLQHNSPIHSVDSWDDVIWIRKYTHNKNRTHKNADMHFDYNTYYHEEPNKKNYSTPDLASVLVMLNEPDEYMGGESVISNGFHPQTGEALFKTLEKAKAGAGVLWDGWTLHGVNPVTSGVRYTLIAHFRGKMKDGSPTVYSDPA